MLRAGGGRLADDRAHRRERDDPVGVGVDVVERVPDRQSAPEDLVATEHASERDPEVPVLDEGDDLFRPGAPSQRDREALEVRGLDRAPLRVDHRQLAEREQRVGASVERCGQE